MAKIIITYIAVVLLVALGFFGVGALASAAEMRDPMQPPAFALQTFREAKRAVNPPPSKAVAAAPKPEPLRLTSIILFGES